MPASDHRRPQSPTSRFMRERCNYAADSTGAVLLTLSLSYCLIVLSQAPSGFATSSWSETTRVTTKDIQESTIKDATLNRPRKLLIDDQGEGGGGDCSAASDLQIVQGAAGTTAGGIPTFSVEVVNTCARRGCAMRDIHVACGWFASARLVDPGVFRRLGYNDCLVKGGGPLDAGDTLTFLYANSFPYPLSLLSAAPTPACRLARRQLPP